MVGGGGCGQWILYVAVRLMRCCVVFFVRLPTAGVFPLDGILRSKRVMTRPAPSVGRWLVQSVDRAASIAHTVMGYGFGFKRYSKLGLETKVAFTIFASSACMHRCLVRISEAFF